MVAFPILLAFFSLVAFAFGWMNAGMNDAFAVGCFVTSGVAMTGAILSYFLMQLAEKYARK